MRSDRWTTALLLSLLGVQTLLLSILLLRLNGVHRSVLELQAAAFGPGAEVAVLVPGFEPGDGPSRGPASAPVTLVEFSDFTCPACADLQPALSRVLAARGQQVRLVFRHFPLAPSGRPFELALAAECAGRQDAFWEAHDAFYAGQGPLEGEAIRSRVLELGVDPAAFDACMASQEAAARVRADAEAGRRYGVDGTPTLFVNGRRLEGVVPPARLEQVIDQALADRGARG